MELINVLATRIELYETTFNISLNWIGNLIRLLISGVSVVGVGIILFSLILKLVVLPFDIYQRIAMRKQNIKMKENQEKMAKLQKQYANDKAMYNQKLMEMYKESGISMFSSCLPMILSLVIFIVAINAFNAYSEFANVQGYNKMAQIYTACLEQYCPELDDSNTTLSVTDDGTTITVNDGDALIYYTLPVPANGVDYKANDYAYIRTYTDYTTKFFYIDETKADGNADIQQYLTAAQAAAAEANVAYSKEDALRQYFIEQGQTAVKENYKSEVRSDTKFLWIKNVWYTDASYKHPVSSYSEFESTVKKEDFKIDGKKVSYTETKTRTNVYTKEAYENITGKLTAEKKEANGYYILIVLSIGTILLQQFVMMHSQKEQQKFSSVDGQGAANQKMMLVIMTVMFGIFSFMYSSAFSLYMITSNLFSLGATLIINKVVDVVMAKKEAAALQEKYNQRFPGRSNNKDGKK
ncbi:MAG: YidC/Oxa1 family membrane protein insertase [Clostridia bacterium]|nr:YidC/Oxa1 family membrane protein insertase [Clostridia bacterium]